MLLTLVHKAQQFGEGSNWYFGQNAGMTFTTSPPTATTGSLVTQEGCSTISDAAGNLLFSTDGSTVYTSNHSVMSNGTGLQGNFSTAQSGVIVRQPGSNTYYYIFTMDASNTGTLNYSVVDMSLASGQGSVVTKNVALVGPCLEKLTAVKHSNNTDIWIVVHGTGTSTTFYAYLLTNAGVNNVPVTSNVGSQASGMSVGYLKFSPDGLKLANAFYGAATVELYDFNRTTGAITNAIQLTTGSSGNYGVEFSPNGSLLYASRGGYITQWDICAGSATAIASTAFTFSATNNWALQLGPDGKIYVARYQQNSLGVINSPNTSGSGCNYVDQGFSISPNQCRLGLPNYVTSWFIPPPPQFTTTIGTPSNGIGCMSASFTAPPTASLQLPGCSALAYTLNGMQWNFGDPNSGAANTTTVSNPIHMFSGLGTYTVSLILTYSNNGPVDTLKQVVNITQPCISVTSSSITCATLGQATVTAVGGVGPFTYTWMPSGQTNSIATGLSPGMYTITVHDAGNNYSYTATTVFTSLIPLSGQLSSQMMLPCNGAATGTASYSNFSGGSGTQTYQWINGTTTLTAATPTNLSAGLWNAIVTDGLTGCQLTDVFLVLEPSAQTVAIAVSNQTICAGSTITFTASTSGGTGPAYNYTWANGPIAPVYGISKPVAGIYGYTVTSKDANACVKTQTVSVEFVANPTISVSNFSICPLETGSLTASGATTYTWSDASQAPTMTASPSANTQYTVIGSALSCTSSATASIILKPIPQPLITSNSPVCNGKNLVFAVSAATAATWTGPLSYTSALKNPTITGAAPPRSGAYQVTVTAANGCSAATSATFTVNPTPTVSASGSTVCTNQTLQLNGSSFPGANFLWHGPAGFSSANQNPAILNPPVSAGGEYTVIVTSVNGCTNSATAQGSVTNYVQASITSDGPRCEAGALSLFGSGAGIYAWFGPSGFTSGAQNPLITNLPTGAAGVYSLQTVNGPCVSQATHAVVVYPLPVPTASFIPPVCETKSLILLGSSSNVITAYQWSGPAGFYSASQYAGRDSSKTTYSGNYTLTVIDNHLCINSATVDVDILPNPTVAATGATVCLNEPAVLTSSGAVIYNWYGPSFFMKGDTVAIKKAYSPSPIEYTVTGAAANSCTSTVTVKLATYRLPEPFITVTPRARACIGSTVILMPAGGVTYRWAGPYGFSETIDTLRIHATHSGFSGTYTLQAFDKHGCTARALTSITIEPRPYADIRVSNAAACIPFCTEISTYPSRIASSTGRSGVTCICTLGEFLAAIITVRVATQPALSMIVAVAI